MEHPDESTPMWAEINTKLPVKFNLGQPVWCVLQTE